MRVVFSERLFKYLLAINLSIFFVLLFIFSTSQANAATINVVSGTDALDSNGQCQFSEAMQNINDQAQTNTDCAAGDGNNDTIQLPIGTVTLSASSYLDNNFIFPTNIIVGSNRSVKIIGVSKTQSIIDGANSYGVLSGGEGNTVEYESFKLVNPTEGGIGSVDATSTIVKNIEINGGQNCVMLPVSVTDMIASNTSVEMEDVYIHDIECTNPGGAPTFSFLAGQYFWWKNDH
jgi:hypothetical protein